VRENLALHTIKRKTNLYGLLAFDSSIGISIWLPAMTLTLVVGSSGSGKTTFLNAVYKHHKCTYLRQYHSIRPYIVCHRIPNFDPTRLPFWHVYEEEGKADSILVGGTMAGKSYTGLSGGQRKLLLFEILYQRCYKKRGLLLALDEPFGGVTEGFLPFIIPRLRALKYEHNILLVTNDHIEALKELADDTITVSALDRSSVKLNNHPERISQEEAIRDLSVGSRYVYEATDADLKFFFDVEIITNKLLAGIVIFTLVAFALFVVTFWNSSSENAALVLIAGGILCYFCISPYLFSLIDWRNCMLEEAEALLHSSPTYNQVLKTMTTIALMIIISVAEYAAVNVVVDGLSGARFWIAMLCESFALSFPYICLGIFTRLPVQIVQMLAGIPFLLLIFLSTTYSPGAGMPGLKSLRYLFARFYFWCMVPSVQDDMEGCPANQALNMTCLILSSCVSLFLFLLMTWYKRCIRQILRYRRHKKKNSSGSSSGSRGIFLCGYETSCSSTSLSDDDESTTCESC